MISTVGDDGFFCVVVGVGLVSIIDQVVRVFPTSAEQTCGTTRRGTFFAGRLISNAIILLQLATLTFRVRSARLSF